jgi:hypothetical protein
LAAVGEAAVVPSKADACYFHQAEDLGYPIRIEDAVLKER